MDHLQSLGVFAECSWTMMRMWMMMLGQLHFSAAVPAFGQRLAKRR